MTCSLSYKIVFLLVIYIHIYYENLVYNTLVPSEIQQELYSKDLEHTLTNAAYIGFAPPNRIFMLLVAILVGFITCID